MANIYVSSGASFSATISIAYPAGSTCTVSNYKKTWTAPNTSGSWTFKANEVGYYTVKAASEDKSKEEEVLITTEGQVATVVLIYELALYTNGAFDTTITREELITNGTIKYGESTINCDISYNAPSYSMIVFKGIDLTQLSTIYLQIDSLGTYKDGTTIAVVPDVESWNPKKPTTGAAAYAYASQSGVTVSELTVDVSAIDGSYDVVVGLNTQGGTWRNGRQASYSEVLIK